MLYLEKTNIEHRHLQTWTVPALFSPRATFKALLGMNLFSTSPFLFATDPRERVLWSCLGLSHFPYTGQQWGAEAGVSHLAGWPLLQVCRGRRFLTWGPPGRPNRKLPLFQHRPGWVSLKPSLAGLLSSRAEFLPRRHPSISSALPKRPLQTRTKT